MNIPVAKPVDVFVKGTFRFGKNVSRLNDGRFAVGVVWKVTNKLSISPFYWYIRARNTAGIFKAENRLSVAATYKLMTKPFGLSHRSTVERRFRPVGNTWRYRAMLTFDKDLPKKFIPGLKLFVADEVFYDSGLKRFSRNRFSVGVTKTVNKHAAVDIYYTRQSDKFTHPGDLNIIWTAWKFRL